MKLKISYVIRALISCILIVILMYSMKDKYGQIIGALKSTRVPIFFLAFLGFLGAISMASLRLRLVISVQDIPVTFKEAISLTLIGYFFNNFLPTAIGGDVAKAYYLSKRSPDKMAAYTAIFVDRLLGLITMILMAFIALSLAQNKIANPMIKQTVYGITIVSLLAVLFISNKAFASKFSILLIFLKPIEERLKAAYSMVHRYKKHNAMLFKSTAISVVSQLLFFLTFGVLAFSIGARISVLDLLLLTPLISALSLLPSINGLGLREGATVMFFGPMIGKEQAFAVSILFLAVLLMTSVIGGIIYGLSPQFKIKLKEMG